MKHFIHLPAFCLLGLVAGAASVPGQPGDLVRQGNAAMARGEFSLAGDYYAQAEERTTDPGLVAFNEATALYQLGRYREAELHLRRCLEDAQGIRRARLLYNLGNCLVQQARGQDTRRLREAVNSYKSSLQQDGAEDALLADARHNLELARVLFLQAKARKENGNPANEDSANDPPPPNDRQEDAPKQGADRGSLSPDGSGKRQRGSPTGREPNAEANANQQHAAGKGDLPPIPDDDDLRPLTAEDAAEHLKQAAERIANEHRTHRQRPMAPAPANVKDW